MVFIAQLVERSPVKREVVSSSLTGYPRSSTSTDHSDLELRVLSSTLMLFSLVYTWIKYKMSPPSVVALNRLFVERDSKHRRITSNLGLTFRNSKWSGYARTNINLDAKTDFLWSLTRAAAFFFTLTVIFTGLGYYNGAGTTNPLLVFYWFAIDSNLYLQVTTISGVFYLVQLSLDALHRKFVSTLFGTAPKPNQVSLAKPEAMQIPKRLHKPLLYSLVQNTTSSDVLEKLLTANPNPPTTFSNLSFLKSLYWTTYLTKLSVNRAPILRLVDSLGYSNHSPVSNVPKFLNNVAKLRQPSLNTLALDYTLFRPNPTSLHLLPHSGLRWNLTSVTGLESPVSTQGLFYLPTIDQTKLHSLTSLYPELSPLNSSLEEQTQVIRWDRWLYKYSLLHRSSLKTGFYLNLFKSSLGSSFYNQDMGTRNLWLPSSLASLTSGDSSSHPGSLHSQLYGRFLNSELLPSLPSSPHFYNKANLAPLSFYESSYHWALRRFYKLNSTSSNQLAYKPTLYTTNQSILGAHKHYSTSAISYSLRITEGVSSLSSQSTLSVPTPPASTLSSLTQSTYSDSYLAYSPQSFFSKERLELLHNVTASRSSKSAIQNNQTHLDSRLNSNVKSPF